jgi:hypothetical protein
VPTLLAISLLSAKDRLPVAMVLLRQSRELHQAAVQALQLSLRHRVEVSATNALLSTRALQPTKKDLGRTGVSDRTFAQTTFDLSIWKGAHAGRALLGSPC